MFRRAVVCWLGLVLVPGFLAAQTKPSSDLLPWFEVDLEGGEATTVFAIVNSLDKQVDVAAALYTNWGLSVITTQFRLKPGEVLTADLRSWIAEGHLPGNKTLTAGELLRAQAMLSGQPSPADGLYHATDVALGHATGYLTLRTIRTGGKKGMKPDALRGEGFLIDPEQGPARGHDLIDIDKTTAKEVCNRHNLRHLSGTGLADARMIVWRDLAGQILPAPAPVDRRRQIDVSVYAADGRLLRNESHRLLPAEQVQVGELGLTEPLGRIEIATAEASVALIQDSAGGPLFESACMQSDPGPKTAVRIETLVNGQDANTPPGPPVPIGSTVNWSYRITNSGTDPLIQISVKGEQGMAAVCPKSALNPGQSMTCTATTTAQACQHRNAGTVTAKIKKGKKGGSTVTAQDPGHYFGEDGAAIEIVTSTNGMDANVPAGPSVLAGSPVSWTYVVTNSGRLRLATVRVSDDRGAAVVCPSTSLDPGQAMTCDAAGVALAGQFANLGTATASTACGEISDSDPSHYFGESDKNVQLRALANGFDADVPPGPSVPVGSPVTWEYIVTNSGKFPLNGLAVSDDKGTAVSCPKAGLTAGESMTCIARGVAASCQNAAFASVTGRTPDGTQVAASNPAHYFGQAEASILIKTSVNGNDADLPPGPSVPIGTPVQWTYTLTNTGKVALSNIVVTDSQGTTAACPRTDLRPGETLGCTATGTAVSGDFRNLGTVTARPPCGDPVRDDDPGHYKGVGDPGIRIRTFVAGQDANLPPGPVIPAGNPVSWEFVVTNTGQFALSGILVSGSRSPAPSCPGTSLQPGQSMTCTASGIAQACQVDYTGTARGTANGQTVTSVDPSYYLGTHQPGVTIETTVNGVEADSATGPTLVVGSTVSWAYKVTNRGDAPLAAIQVADDQGAAVSCPTTFLQPGESMTCTATGTAQEGQFANIGTVTASPPCGAAISAQDASHYFGELLARIQILLYTYGLHATVAPGPDLLFGSPVSWTYLITNTGRAALSSITVSDSKGVLVDCPKTTLEAEEFMECTGSSTVIEGEHSNVGFAAGKSPYGKTVTASETNYYVGKRPSIRIETTTNGQEDDVRPGIQIVAGTTFIRTYFVTNTTPAQLRMVQVADDAGLSVTCPKNILDSGESMSCQATGTTLCGDQNNTATATGQTADAQTASHSDPSRYEGTEAPGIEIKSFVNDDPADTAPGPALASGSSATAKHVVTNTGNVPIRDIVMTDEEGMGCARSGALAPNASFICTGSFTVNSGINHNNGTVNAMSICNTPVSDTDPAYYEGCPSGVCP